MSAQGSEHPDVAEEGKPKPSAKGRKPYCVESRSDHRSIPHGWTSWQRYRSAEAAADGCAALTRNYGFLGYEFRVSPAKEGIPE